MADKDRANKKAGGDAPVQSQPQPPPPILEEKTPEMIALEEAERRAEQRRQMFRKRWPSITKVKIKTVPWSPPGPPIKPQPVLIEYPPLKLHKWTPPWMRRRKERPKHPRVPPEEMNKPLYDSSTLRRIWHNFMQVEPNKMILQGSLACNSKKYNPKSGAQTCCIAAVAKALLDEKPASNLVRRDVDDCIEAGHRYYKSCIVGMKCYKGNPSIEPSQLLPSFFLHDTLYTITLTEIERGVLAKHPDNTGVMNELMGLMEKRIGQTYAMILSIGDKHFFIWGHPPESPSSVRTICYILDPHMLDEYGNPHPLHGAGAFLRYAGVNSFVTDLLSNYGPLDRTREGIPQPEVVLTDIEISQKEPLRRHPDFQMDLDTRKMHCKAEWESYNYNALLEKKSRGQYPLASLSAVSLASSRASKRKGVKEFYNKAPPEPPPPTLPMQPEKAPPPPTFDQIMAYRGEDFFLYCPNPNAHMFGRDDMVPMPKSETMLYSPVEIQCKNFCSQYQAVDQNKWIIRANRHMASLRYSAFKTYTAIACCLAAITLLHRLRARAWNDDILDETLDLGFNLYRDSLVERGGPIRRLVLGELKERYVVRNKEYLHKERGIAVWGKIIVSNNPNVYDLCGGIEQFFKEADTGILQIPGHYETAIWHEGSCFYIYHPWPADRDGYRVGLQDGGRACIVKFDTVQRLCEHFSDSVADARRRPFSISDVYVTETQEPLPEPLNYFKTVAPNRWLVRGNFNEYDDRFADEHRGKQCTPTSIAAIAMAHITDPDTWTNADVDETLMRGDMLYESTMEHLEKMGINLEAPKEEAMDEDEGAPPSTLAAADVLNRFKITDFDCIETEVYEGNYNGVLRGDPDTDTPSLKESLKALFKEHNHAVFTARGTSKAIWKKDDCYYFFDPHGCDENGYPSDEPMTTSCLVRVKGSVEELSDIMESSLDPGPDDSFTLSPVEVIATKLNAEIGAPETTVESKQFQWIKRGTAAILPGPRGENSAIGKAARKAFVPKEDLAGRTIALPAAAAFCAAAAAVPPPHMHQDHMFNFLDAGADYYMNFFKKTGRREILPEDLTEKFEMGANTFSIELGEPMKLPLRLPDKAEGEGGGDEEEREMGEEEEPTEQIKEIKQQLFKLWYDTTKQQTLHLLVGDYHQLGVWMAAGGKVVVFDPAPVLGRGWLTPQRIRKGDELRLQRLRDEMTGEAGGDDDEVGEEEGGEEKPEPEPDFVPPESTPCIMVFASPGEFIDKLVNCGPLDNAQMIAPYKLYPVTVTNQLTNMLKERKPATKTSEEEEAEDAEDVLIEPLEDSALGKHFDRLGRAKASLRGRLAQHESYFMERPNRDNQDAANSIMGIVVEHIEPYVHWKPQLIDAVVKYGDRLHTLSLPNASKPPKLKPSEVANEFHVTSFNVKTEVTPEVVCGDIKAAKTGTVLNLERGIEQFFTSDKYGVLCAKGYCVGIWKGADDKSYCLWEPHVVGPTGRWSPGGAAGLILFSTVEELAETFKSNVEVRAIPGNNQFCISSVKVQWELVKQPPPVVQPGTVPPDEGYEFKVLTAYVESGRGRTILRGSRPPDLAQFNHDCIVQSACGAIVGACMTRIRRPHLWTHRTVDDIYCISCKLFKLALNSLGYEFRPGEDALLPLQVPKRFVLGVNYIRYDLVTVYTGKLEQTTPPEMSLRAAVEQFFQGHNLGIIWSAPYAVAIWKDPLNPEYYMMEPQPCGATGLRMDAMDDGAACVLTFTSPKLLAFHYLQNTPMPERHHHDFQLHAMVVEVTTIKDLGGYDPPLLKTPRGLPTNKRLVPATSNVNVYGKKRRANESDRAHPPGDPTCTDAAIALEKRDHEEKMPRGQRYANGWLGLPDGQQFLSACHSISCKKFCQNCRGNQAIACCVMAVAMTKVEEICKWCSNTLDAILDSGNLLYQDSYLHYRPDGFTLTMQQVLRKFYTPGNCVCRVVVYRPRQMGEVENDLHEQLPQFFREEDSGVLVAGDGRFAVALFKTDKGFYMFDPMDRDRYGRAVAPPCVGKARACLSKHPNVRMLADKLFANIPPEMPDLHNGSLQSVDDDKDQDKDAKDKVKFKQEMVPTRFMIFGMDVTSLKRVADTTSRR